jgi:hypothetical protein
MTLPRRVVSGLLLVAWLSACATSRTYGSFLKRADAPYEERMALDAARLLERLYPAAKSEIEIAQSDDAFGERLVTKLRENGFAVASGESRGARDQIELRYIVDPLGDFFRVTLLLKSGSGTTALARAYARTRAGLAPAGAWARQLH